MYLPRRWFVLLRCRSFHLLPLAAVLLLASCADSLAPGLRIGNRAPEISGEATNSQPITLSQFERKVVLIDFWGTWCGPCRQSIPHTKDLYRAYEGRPFAILGVAYDNDRQKLRSFLDSEKVTWPNIFDASGNICDQWQIKGFPSYVLVDHHGVIVGRWEGGGQMEQIGQAVAEAVREAEKK